MGVCLLGLQCRERWHQSSWHQSSQGSPVITGNRSKALAWLQGSVKGAA